MNLTIANTVFAETAPAGGAATGEIVIATAAASLLTGLLLYIGFGYREGRIAWLHAFAERVELRSGYPAWTAIPVIMATTSLLVALLGMYWDVALHIADGRDEGPLANPAHYFILAGLFGIFTAGFLAIVLPKERPSETAIYLGRDWYAPLGGVMICACGAFSLIGFPLDDFWHRLFGQDVTLWGPTHLMLIGGAAMTLVGIGVLSVEGMRAEGRVGMAAGERRHMVLARSVALTGGFLIGLSTFQAEFDFGVPQFRFVLEPMMVMIAAGVALVTARLYAGPGAAIGAVAFFLVIRGLLAVFIGPVLGEPMPHMPLYIIEALVVEAVALRVPPGRPLAFGVWSGVGIGTVGLASEWAWSHVWMPYPWPAELLPEAAVAGFATALAAGLIGAWIGTRLAVDSLGRRPGLRLGAALGALTIAISVGLALYTPERQGQQARVVVRDIPGDGARHVSATIAVQPRDAAEGAEWFNVTAWQGQGLVVDPLRRVGPGVYRTTKPIPVHGNWKALVRFHDGTSLGALPIFMPRDAAIPAPEVPASASFTRAFVDETTILQREKTGGSTATVVLAYGTVLGIALSLLTFLAWGLHRLAFPAHTRRCRQSAAKGRARVATGRA